MKVQIEFETEDEGTVDSIADALTEILGADELAMATFKITASGNAEKKCSSCQQTKQEASFYLLNKKTGRRDSYCKDCRKEINNSYYKERYHD